MAFPVILFCILFGGQLPAAEAAASEFDFGRFPANLERKHEFSIVNSAAKKLTLGKIRNSCGCTSGTLGQTKLKPGESTRFAVAIEANSLRGPFVKTIYIETDNPERRFLKFSLKGDAIPVADVQPDPLLYIGTLTPGRSYRYTFRITPRQPGLQLQLPPFRHDDLAQRELTQRDGEWLLTVTLLPRTPDRPFRLEFPVEVASPSGWPPIRIVLSGRFSAGSATTPAAKRR